MFEVSTRTATLADANLIAEILTASQVIPPWPGEEIARFFQNAHVQGLIAVHAGLPVAAILFRSIGTEAEIVTLGVVAAFRRRGVAKMLLTQVIEDCAGIGVTKIFLEVAINNKSAYKLYRNLGFLHAGIRPNYYRSHDYSVDAVILTRVLP